jgi:hypothetical protein
MEQWWNDTDRGKLKYWEKNVIHLPVPIVWTFCILNLLEPQGSVQACSGNALLVTIYSCIELVTFRFRLVCYLVFNHVHFEPHSLRFVTGPPTIRHC